MNILNYLIDIYRPSRSEAGSDKPAKASPSLSAAIDANPFFGLKVWCPPKEEPHLVDIVFVHGLTGDLDDTWKALGASEPWPKEVLPAHFPHARVLTYGYDAYVVLRQGLVSDNRLSDHSLNFLSALVGQRQQPGQARIPLIFVAHSLGGLVCKDVLLNSQNSPDKALQAVLAATSGICFMGTPHAGSWLADKAEVVVRLLRRVRSTNQELLSVLRKHSEVATRINDNFLNLIRVSTEAGQPIEVVCFFEELPMLPMGKYGKIVSRDSAVLGGYEKISIHKDHKDMVKFFAQGNDPGRDQLLAVMTRWIEKIETPNSPEHSSNGKWQVFKRRCLESFSFANSTIGKAERNRPHEGTCQWVYEHPQYRKWVPAESKRQNPTTAEEERFREERSKLLYVKGKPGSGKSTLMKEMFEYHRQNAQNSTWHCVGFFFKASGGSLRKSPSGLYRSLLYQLFKSSSRAFRDAVPRLTDKLDAAGSDTIYWTKSELAELFHWVISRPTSPRCYVFVDAMDECDKNALAEIVKDFAQSLRSTAGAGNLRICLSSRHYPNIIVKDALELHVEDSNGPDIRAYVHDNLEEMLYPNPELLLDLENLMVNKASGVFLWARFVIEELRSARSRGRPNNELRALVHSLPSKLEKLFAAIAKTMSLAQRRTTLRIAHWVLAAADRRPLTWQELYLALKFDNEKSITRLTDLVQISRQEGYDLKQFEKLIVYDTCGLFELVAQRSEDHIVQFVHETVRAFLLSPTGLGIFGIESKDDMAEKQAVLIDKCFWNFANTEEIGAAFDSTQSTVLAPVKRYIDYCYRNHSDTADIPYHSLSQYFLLYGFQHLEESPWFQQRKSDSYIAESTPRELRRLVESWLFIYCLITERFEEHPHLGVQIERSSAFLAFVAPHVALLGMSDPDFGSLFACVNNRDIFCRYIPLMSERRLPLHHAAALASTEYMLLFWTASDEKTSVVHEIKEIESAVEGGHKAVDLKRALACCAEIGRGFAFMASFRTERAEPRSISELTTWAISEDFPLNASLRPKNFIHAPFHATADSGYITVLLRRHSAVELPEVLAIHERDDHGALTSKRPQEVSQWDATAVLRRKNSSESLTTYQGDNKRTDRIWRAWPQAEDDSASLSSSVEHNRRLSVSSTYNDLSTSSFSPLAILTGLGGGIGTQKNEPLLDQDHLHDSGLLDWQEESNPTDVSQSEEVTQLLRDTSTAFPLVMSWRSDTP